MTPANGCQSSMRRRARILFLDAYDSFTNNITSLLTTLLDAEVRVLVIDDPLIHEGFEAFLHELRHYDAVVCGPGPGDPAHPADVGLMRQLWEIPRFDSIPVLGICLGFQSLVMSHGGKVGRLPQGLHGRVWQIHAAKERPRRHDIFQGVESFQATLYHSLGVVEKNVSWAHVPLVPLALATATFGENIVMAVKHTIKPLWGLQYHPESICTEEKAHVIISNWFRAALAWNRSAARKVLVGGELRARQYRRSCLLSRNTLSHTMEKPYTMSQLIHMPPNLANFAIGWRYHSASISGCGMCETQLLELTRRGNRDIILLDSSNSTETRNEVRGRYSILALDVDQALHIEHQAGNPYARLTIPKNKNGESVSEYIRLNSNNQDSSIWEFLAHFLDKRRIPLVNCETVPFAGGFIGYFTYEMGLQNISVNFTKGEQRSHKRPDVSLVWVTRSIVMDHDTGKLIVQCLADEYDGSTFIHDTMASLEIATKAEHNETIRPEDTGSRSSLTIKTPQPTKYEAKVRTCQEYIAAGDSYELCLTDQTTFTLQIQTGSDISWDLYKHLRKAQPAPFASYLRIGGITLVSGSPERFLEYRPRPRQCEGKDEFDWVCTMRPMKGTVRKAPSEAYPAGVTTAERARSILHTEKEIAENLMIVDLVRHDMHGVCGAGRVSVPRLMVVEEYRSVWQMVTVVEGLLPKVQQFGDDGSTAKEEMREIDENSGDAARYTGLDLLAASLPPGSMTGAPKRRSCQILREIEGQRERGLYSGIVGYMDACGRGDWSVTIRSAFRYDDESQVDNANANGKLEKWHIGAGGAVTILSTPEGEREEMFTKLAGPLSVFENFFSSN